MVFDLFLSAVNIPFATLFYAIGWYLFMRIIAIHSGGEIILTKRMRRFFLPFSKKRTTNGILLIEIAVCYIEFLMYLVSKIPVVAEYIGGDFYHYNYAGLCILFLSFGPGLFWIAFVRVRGSRPAAPGIEKFIFYFTILFGTGWTIFWSFGVFAFLKLIGSATV